MASKTEPEAKAKHPSGRKVPRVEILQRLSSLVDEHQWLYGSVDSFNATRQERWDVRSLLDYAILTTADARLKQPTYSMFYRRRDVCMALLYDAHNRALQPGPKREMIVNYGDWRMYETDSDTTGMKILKIVQDALAQARLD